MRVLILADGEPPSPSLAQRLARQADLCIATDGAAHKAVTLGITPDIVCGDFDSINLKAVQAAFPGIEIVPTPDQSRADLEKGLLLALSRGAAAVAIVGATGGRIDHTLSSFALLQRYAHNLPVCLLADRPIETPVSQERPDCASVTWAVTEGYRCVFAANPGEIVSLVSFADATVSIQGVRWPLVTHTLSPGTQGVSNVAVAPHIVVEVHAGSLFLTHLAPQPAGFDFYIDYPFAIKG